MPPLINFVFSFPISSKLSKLVLYCFSVFNLFQFFRRLCLFAEKSEENNDFSFFLPLFLTGVCLVPEKTNERKGKESHIFF